MKKLELGEKEVRCGNVYDHNCIRKSLCVRKMLEGNTWKGRPMIFLYIFYFLIVVLS